MMDLGKCRLRVNAVVEGTGIRVGNRVRITAELVQVSTDHHLWAETPGLSVQTDLDWLFLAMRKSSPRQNWGAQSGDRLVGNKSVENLAEREGFYYRRFFYLAVMPTLP